MCRPLAGPSPQRACGGNAGGLPVATPPKRLARRRPLFPLTKFSLSTAPQAKRRRQFENSQDMAKRRLKEVRMRRSK